MKRCKSKTEEIFWKAVVKQNISEVHFLERPPGQAGHNTLSQGNPTPSNQFLNRNPLSPFSNQNPTDNGHFRICLAIIWTQEWSTCFCFFFAQRLFDHKFTHEKQQARWALIVIRSKNGIFEKSLLLFASIKRRNDWSFLHRKSNDVRKIQHLSEI